MFIKKNINHLGFTIAEIIITVGILAVVAGLGLIVSLDFYQRYSIDTDKDSLIGVLRKARSLSMNNFNGQPHGVFIESGHYTVFQGNSYASRQQAYDQIFNISPAVSLSISLGGVSEIVFWQLSGDSNASGTINLISGAVNRAISINYEGRID